MLIIVVYSLCDVSLVHVLQKLGVIMELAVDTGERKTVATTPDGEMKIFQYLKSCNIKARSWSEVEKLDLFGCFDAGYL